MIKINELSDGECIRQGDVLVIKTERKLDSEAEIPRDNGGVVLAYGEVTGHSHQFRDNGVVLMSLKGETLDKALKISEPATLRHEEHTHFRLPIGDYTVRIQQQWDGEFSRQVED